MRTMALVITAAVVGALGWASVRPVQANPKPVRELVANLTMKVSQLEKRLEEHTHDRPAVQAVDLNPVYGRLSRLEEHVSRLHARQAAPPTEEARPEQGALPPSTDAERAPVRQGRKLTPLEHASLVQGIEEALHLRVQIEGKVDIAICLDLSSRSYKHEVHAAGAELRQGFIQLSGRALIVSAPDDVQKMSVRVDVDDPKTPPPSWNPAKKDDFSFSAGVLRLARRGAASSMIALLSYSGDDQSRIRYGDLGEMTFSARLITVVLRDGTKLRNHR